MTDVPVQEPQEVTVPEELQGRRLDQIAAQLFPEHSRSRLKRWIEEGQLTVNDTQTRPREPLHAGDRLSLLVRYEEPDHTPLAEDLPLNIVHEDDDLIVINKAAGMIVHPGAGNNRGTLVNALLHHYPELSCMQRAGLIHRLDKETTGLLVIARHPVAQTALSAAMQARDIRREYEALVVGLVIAGGTVDQPLGRDPRERTRMAIVPDGREAVTHYRVLERFAHHTRLGLRLETGRTHQIRVHMAHLRRPIVGDPDYGGRLRLPRGASAELVAALRGFRRQALHAARLTLKHPGSGEICSWRAPLPDDHAALLAAVRAEPAP